MTDIAGLGIRVSTSGVREATVDLEKLAETGKRNQAQAEALANSQVRSLTKSSDAYKSFVAERKKEYVDLEGGARAALKKINAEWDEHKSKLKDISKEGALRSIAAQQEAARPWQQLRAQFQEEQQLYQRRNDAIAAFEAQLTSEITAEAAKRTAAKQQEVSRSFALIKEQTDGERRLAQMRADATAAFSSGPNLNAEAAALEKEAGVRQRLSAFLATERGQRILAAEAINKQGAALNGSSIALGKNVKSSKELQFALRGVPAQFTDIATSLSMGQRPLQVFLQQGGQLKDMFGGIGPAAKALGGYVVGLINPLTIGAAAVGTLAYALNQAEEEQSAFSRALLVSGNYAGKTSTQLESLVGSIAKTSDVTRGTARDAIQRAAESGRFAGDQFELVAKAAARMEEATGQSVDDTIKKFESIGRAPVDALLKLNETEHFLTQAQLDRVRGLEDEGRVQDAAAEGARIYASRLDDVATAAEAARPHLSRMWKDAKEGASSAWEEAKKFTDFLAAAAEKSKEVPWYQRLGPVGGLRAISALYGAEPATAQSAPPVGKTVDTAKARAYADFQKEGLRYATKQAKLEHDIAQAKADGLKAGASQLEIDKRIADIRASYAEKAPKGRKTSGSTADPFASLNGLVQKAQVFDQGVGGDKANNAQVTSILAIVDAGAKLITSGHDVTQVQAQVAKGVAALNEGYAKQAKILATENATAIQQYQASLDKQNGALQRSIDSQIASISLGAKEAQQQQQINALYEKNAQALTDLQLRRDAVKAKGGDTAVLDADIVALKKNIDQQVKIVTEGMAAIDAAESDGMSGVHRAIQNFLDQQKDVAGQMERLTTQFIGGFGDAFADFVSGTKSAKDAFGSLIDSMYQQALKFVANKAIQALFNSLGNTGSGSGGSSAGGWAGLIGGLFSSSGPGTIGAGLANGGPAAAGSVHPVVENGPEILNVGTRSYLMMGKQSGSVTPLSESRGGRSPTYITNINVQPTSTRRTAEQVAAANARTQRIAQSRNA